MPTLVLKGLSPTIQIFVWKKMTLYSVLQYRTSFTDAPSIRIWCEPYNNSGPCLGESKVILEILSPETSGCSPALQRPHVEIPFKFRVLAHCSTAGVLLLRKSSILPLTAVVLFHTGVVKLCMVA